MASVGVFNHNNVEVWRRAKLNSCGDNQWVSHCPHLNTKGYLSGRTEEGFQQFPDYNEDSLYYSINGQWINESFAIRLRANIPVAWCMLGKKDKYSDFRYQNLTICMVFQGINEVEKWCNQKKKKKKNSVFPPVPMGIQVKCRSPQNISGTQQQNGGAAFS